MRTDALLAISHIDAMSMNITKNRAMIAKAAKGDAGGDDHYG